MVTKERLRELFDYSDETGLFTRLVSVARRPEARAGYVLNGCQNNGYMRVMVDGKSCLLHRLVFAYKGIEINGQVDHINGDRQDNRFKNLRVVSHAENGRNTKLPVTNKSGVMGVCWDSNNGKWYAQIKFDGVTHFLGRFDDLNEAKKVRFEKEREFGFHKNHGAR